MSTKQVQVFAWNKPTLTELLMAMGRFIFAHGFIF